jgi:threonine synthase
MSSGTPKNRFVSLQCISCGTDYPETTRAKCAKCSGILSGKFDLSGKNFDLASRSESIWQFRDMMPAVVVERVVSMGEGWTPLVSAKRYGRTIGNYGLLCKIEGANPSGSFKDRVASLGISLAASWGKEGVFTASSGNAAAAVSAYAARAGLGCLVLIREDSTPSKLGQIAMYGPKLMRVRGIFQSQETLAKTLETTQRALPTWLNHFVWAPYNPLLIDALKTIAYEIAADSALSGLPDYVVVPTAGGDLLYGIFKGFLELRNTGAINQLPKMIVAQGLHADPTVEAVEAGLDTVPETKTADTIAGALRVNFGADHSVAAIKQSRGFGVAVSDDEILEAQRQIASLEGIFTEISSATALAAVAKATKNGRIQKDEKVVAILTGSGFKDYHPPFEDISAVPFVESIDSLPSKLRSSYGL